MKSYTLHAVAFLLLLSDPCLARDYLVDSQEEFIAISDVALQPGDAILLKRGMQFIGMLSPTGNGTEKAPIRIDVYGEGDRPRIDANGKQVAGLLLMNPTHWEVQGLEITNTDGTEKDQGTLFGIYVLAQDLERTNRHVVINDCYIHDVNGINTTFRNNLYFNIEPHGSDNLPIEADPGFTLPGKATADIDLKTMTALEGYRLKPDSPCIDAGVPIRDHGGKDLLQKKVDDGKADLGAIEF